MGFRGTYEYRIDRQGRVPLPARYRESFAAGVVLAEGPEGCIEVYTPEGHEKWSAFVASKGRHTPKGRRIRRGAFAPAFDADLDGQGRVLIPARCRQYAALEGPVIIVGGGECLEIWNPQRWEAEEAIVKREYPQDLASMEERQ